MAMRYSSLRSFHGIRWQAIRESIVGKRFEVSVAVVGEKEMRRIRRLLASRKDFAERFPRKHHWNVLSFPLGPHEGEILLNRDEIQKEAKKLKHAFRERLLYLFIHGLLHLKGYSHDTKRTMRVMRREEKKYIRRFAHSVKNRV